MSLHCCINGMSSIIDPKHHYISKHNPSIDFSKIVDACGLIPSFLSNNSILPAKEQLELNYGCGRLYEFKKDQMWVDEAGWLHSAYEEPSEDGPGEPPLAPLMKIELPTESVSIYPNAFVVVTNDDDNTHFITRMD